MASGRAHLCGGDGRLTVLILETVSPSLRGECTRWLLEVRAGVFLGTVSAAVRERLWTMVKTRADGGSCLIAYAANNEQGFCMEVYGDPRRTVIDFDGLQLIKIKQ